MKKNSKLNSKGYMLVEVIIASVVVGTIMTSLYIVFSRVYNVYQQKGFYTSVDDVYALKNLEDYLIDLDSKNTLNLNKLINSTGLEGEDITDNIPEEIRKKIRINKIYFVKLTNEKILATNFNNKLNTVNKTLKDYASYLRNAVKFTGDYIFIIETYELSDKNNVLNKYAYLEIYK